MLSVAEVLNDLRSDTYGRDSMSRFDVKDYPDFLIYFHRKTEYSVRISDNHKKVWISGVRGRRRKPPPLFDQKKCTVLSLSGAVHFCK